MTKRNLYIFISVISLLALMTIWGNLFYILPSLIPSDNISFLIILNVLSFGMLFFGVHCIHAKHYDHKKNIVGIALNALVLLLFILSMVIGGYENQTSPLAFTIPYSIFAFLNTIAFIMAMLTKKE